MTQIDHSSSKSLLSQYDSINASHSFQQAEKINKLMIQNLELESLLQRKVEELNNLQAENQTLLVDKNTLMENINISSQENNKNDTDLINNDIPVDLAANFLPNAVVEYISSNKKLNEPHFEVMEEATLLFLDISGYTKLAEALGSIGSEGTEVLSNSISTFFETAILMIYSHGGDVIKFCGDALMCTFSADKKQTTGTTFVKNINEKAQHVLGTMPYNQQSKSCQLALECALCQMEKLRGFEAAEGVILDLKIMLGKGAIMGNYVGNKDHWEYLLTGDVFNQISDAEHSANPGDIVVSSQVWDASGDLFKGESVPGTNLRLLKSRNSPQPLACPMEKPYHLWIEHAETIVQLLEPEVIEKLRALHGTWTRIGQSHGDTMRRLSKHDNACTIFILIKEEVNDPRYASKNLETMQKAFMCCYSPLRKYGGTLRQFLMDDKGMVAILVFTGKESNATLASRCAIDVRAEMTKHQIDTSIGIASGRVFCGPVGCPYRCEYAFIGDSVNLAARLMCKAEGNKIITDRATADSASRSIQFHENGEVSLKGKSGKIPIFEVLHVKANSVQKYYNDDQIQNLQTTDGVFDNIASFLPSQILDIIVRSCFKYTTQMDHGYIVDKTEVKSHTHTVHESASSRESHVIANNFKSSMRQAVCISLKVNINDLVSYSKSKGRRHRSSFLKTSSSQTVAPASEGLSDSEIDIMHSFVNEIRARVIDHGGDLISIKNNKITILFFAGELSVRHNDTNNTSNSSKQKKARVNDTSTALSMEISQTYAGMNDNCAPNITAHKRMTATCDISVVALNAVGFLSRQPIPMRVGLGIGNVTTILSLPGFSGAYTHFGECIDQAHKALDLTKPHSTSICCPLDIMPILTGTGLLHEGVTTTPATNNLFTFFKISAEGVQKFINPGLSVPIPFVRRFLSPEQLDMAVQNIIRYSPLPLSKFAENGESLKNLNTFNCPKESVCVIIKTRLCSETNLSFFGKDPNAHLIVQEAIDSVTSGLEKLDSYITSCNVDCGELEVTCLLDEDVAMVAFSLLGIVASLKSQQLLETQAFVSTGFVSYKADSGVFLLHDSSPSSCINNAKKLMNITRDNFELNYTSIICDSSCPLASQMPWLMGFRKILVPDAATATTSSASSPTASPTTFFNAIYEPYEKITEVSEQVYRSPANIKLVPVEGRRLLLDQLKTFAMNQETSVVVVEGGEGYGKSHLVRELSEITTSLGLRTMIGCSSRSRKNTSFHVWFNVFRQLLVKEKSNDIDPEKLDSVTASQRHLLTKTKVQQLSTRSISQTLTSDLALTSKFIQNPSLIPLLNDILPFECTSDSQLDTDEAKGSGGRKRRLELYASIIEENCSFTNPLVLILEDWQHADSLSWKLLFLIQTICHNHLHIVITIDSKSKDHDYHVLKTNPDLTQIELKSFELNSVRSICAEAVGKSEITMGLARVLYKASGGVPFLLEQLIYYLIDAKLLTPEEEKTKIETFLEEKKLLEFVSRSEQKTKIANLRAKYLCKKEVLFCCILHALEGESCTAQELLDFHQSGVTIKVDSVSNLLSDQTIEENIDLTDEKKILDELCERKLVLKDTDKSSYSLKNDCLTCDLFLVHNKKYITSLHVNLAYRLKKQNARSAEIAHQFMRGNMIMEEKEYLLKAGNDSIEHLCAPQEAIKLLTRLLKLIGENEDYGNKNKLDPDKMIETGHVHFMLGESYYHIGNMSKAYEHLHEAIRLFGRPPGASIFRGRFGKSKFHMLMYGLGKVIKLRLRHLLHDGVTKIEERGKLKLSPTQMKLAKERCMTWFRLTQIEYLRGNFVEYCYCAIQQYASSEPLGRSSEMCNAMTQFIPIASALGYRRTAEHYCRESMQMCENIEDQNVTALSLMGRAVYMASDGQFMAAIELNEAAQDLFDRVGNVQSWCESIAMMIVCNSALGNFQFVVNLAETAIDTCYKADNFTLMQWFAESKINAMYVLGKTSEVDNLLKMKMVDGYNIEETVGVMQDEFFVPEHARVLLQDGNFDAAVKEAEKYLKYAKRKAWWNMHTFAVCNEIFSSAHVVAKHGHGHGNTTTINGKTSKELLKLATKACDTLKHISKKFACAKPEFDLAMGRLLYIRGKEVTAQKLWAQAIYESDNFMMTPLKGRACLEMAKNCSMESLSVRQYYAKLASEIFKDHGMMRFEIKANVINTRLKPSMINSNLNLGMSSGVGLLGHASLGDSERVILRLQGKNSVGEEKDVGFAQATGNGMDVELKEAIPLTGRDQELSILMKRANSLRTDMYVGSVLIEGDAGFGKSALLRTFLKDTASAFNSFATALYGNAFELEQEVPYHGWAGILCSYFDIKANDAVIFSKQKIITQLSDTPNRDLYPLLNPFFPFNFDETDSTKNMEPSSRNTKTTDLVISLFSQGMPSYNNCKLVLVIDDAQWCDSPSWNLIAQVAQRAQNVLLVVALRMLENEANINSYETLKTLRGTERMVLSTLPSSAFEEYLCALLRVRGISDDLLSFVEKKSCGNFLYVQEAVMSMVEDGVLVQNGGICAVRPGTELEDIDMPNSVGAVIGSRIERLSAPQQQLLCCAAVIGNEFYLDTLLQVHPAPDLLSTVDNDLKVLLQRNLIEMLGGKSRRDLGNLASGGREFAEDFTFDRHQSFQFVHKFTQETAYNRMLVSTRRQVHLALAQFIEVKYSSEIQTLYAVLADHYFKAERMDEAKFYLFNAGDLAIECCACSEALAFFHKVLEIMKLQKRKRTSRRRGEKNGEGDIIEGEQSRESDGGGGRRRGSVKIGGGGNGVDDSRRQVHSSGSSPKSYNVFSDSSQGGIGDLSMIKWSKSSFEEGHVYRQIGEAHFAQNHLKEAREAIVKSLFCFGEGNYKRANMSWMAIRWNVLKTKRWVKKAWTRSNLVESDLDGKNRLIVTEKAKAWYRLCQICFLENDITSNLKAFFQGIKSSSTLGPSLELSNALSIMIPIMSTLDYGKYGEHFSKIAMKMSTELQIKEAIATCNQARSIHLSGRGALVSAEELLKTAVQTFEVIGDLKLWNESNWLLMKVLHCQGKFREEFNTASNHVRIMEQNDAHAAYIGLNVLTVSLVSMGRIDEARATFERALDKKEKLMKKERERIRGEKRKKKKGKGLEEDTRDEQGEDSKSNTDKKSVANVTRTGEKRSPKSNKRAFTSIRVGFRENPSDGGGRAEGRNGKRNKGDGGITKIYNLGITEVLTSCVLLFWEGRFNECFHQVEFLINNMGLFRLSGEMYYFCEELVTVGELLGYLIPILKDQHSADFSIMGHGVLGSSGEEKDSIDKSDSSIARRRQILINGLNANDSAITGLSVVKKHFHKCLKTLQTFSNRLPVGKAAYFYLSGLYMVGVKGKHGKAKIFLEKAIVVGKQSGTMGVVAKSYHKLGILGKGVNNATGTGNNEVNGVFNSSASKKYKPAKIHSEQDSGGSRDSNKDRSRDGSSGDFDSNQKISTIGEVDSEQQLGNENPHISLHKAYLYAKECDMGQLMNIVRRELEG